MDGARTPLGKALKKEALKTLRRAKYEMKRLRSARLHFSGPHGERSFTIGKQLGEGGYATIWRVHERQPDCSEVRYAVKRVVFDGADPEARALIAAEVALMKALPPHPNVVSLVGFCRPEGRAPETVYLLLELCDGGSLAALLQRRAEARNPLRAVDVCRAVADTALALAHLHAQSPPIAHRDVKPENILLGADGRFKLCDFGSATAETFSYTVYETSNAAVGVEEERVHRYCTPQYRAPELCDVRCGERLDERVDLWALGVALYKMLFLADLFGTSGEEKLAVLNFDPDARLDDANLQRLAKAAGGGGDSSERLATPRDLGLRRRSMAERDMGGAMDRHSEEATRRALWGALRMCLARSPAARPSASMLLEWMGATDGEPAAPLRIAAGAAARYRAGVLTVRVDGARGLQQKGVGDGEVYAQLLTSAGANCRTSGARGGGAGAVEWREDLRMRTHSLEVLRVCVWRLGGATADFLGEVHLNLAAEIAEPHAAAELDESWHALERRTAKSRVAGEVSLRLSWTPLATAAAPKAAASGASGSAEDDGALPPTMTMDAWSATFGGSVEQFERVDIVGEETPAAGGFKIDDDNSFWAQFDAPTPQATATPATGGGGGDVWGDLLSLESPAPSLLDAPLMATPVSAVTASPPPALEAGSFWATPAAAAATPAAPAAAPPQVTPKLAPPPQATPQPAAAAGSFWASSHAPS